MVNTPAHGSLKPRTTFSRLTSEFRAVIKGMDAKPEPKLAVEGEFIAAVAEHEAVLAKSLLDEMKNELGGSPRYLKTASAALFTACENGDRRMAQMLFSEGISPNATFTGEAGNPTAVWATLVTEDYGITLLLAEKGADISPDEKKMINDAFKRELFQAVAGEPDILRLNALVRLGADTEDLLVKLMFTQLQTKEKIETFGLDISEYMRYAHEEKLEAAIALKRTYEWWIKQNHNATVSDEANVNQAILEITLAIKRFPASSPLEVALHILNQKEKHKVETEK